MNGIDREGEIRIQNVNIVCSRLIWGIIVLGMTHTGTIGK